MSDQRPVLALVDGYSLLFRAFFAIPGLRTTDGRPTNALYGFASMVLNLLENFHPTAAAVCWDAPAATFRHVQFEAYKAQRPETPDDLKAQVEPVRRMIDVLGLPLVEAPGFEADDVVGTLAKRAAEDGYDVLIVTGDNDAMQLVNDRVRVVTTRRGVSDVVIYDAPAVVERYGVRPDQMVDYKALTGDTSDNIPGVKGIGEKTASKLIVEFGSLDGIYENLDKVQPERIRRLLEEGRESAFTSQDLARIRCDIPIDSDPKLWALEGPDNAAAAAFFTEFEMRTLKARFEKALQEIENPPLIATPAEPALPAVTRETRYRTLGSAEEIAAFAKSVDGRAVSVAPDINTGGGIRGIALSATPGEAVYVPLAEAAPGTLSFGGGIPVSALDVVWDACRGKVIGHQLKPVLRRLGGKGLTPVFDSAIAGYLLDATRSDYRIGDMARNLLNVEPSHEFEGRKDTEPDEHRAQRLTEEADLALLLVEPARSAMRSAGVESVFDDIELPLAPILAEMERTGIAVNVAALKGLSEGFDQAIRDVEAVVHSLAGEKFNIASPKQLQAVLFDKMGLKAGRKTKSGYSTDSTALEQIAADMVSSGQDPAIIAGILEFRELTKLKATYTDALLNLVDPNTGRVHTTFNQTVAATGRLSSSDPNLQNIPVRTGIGRKIRRAFIPGSGKVLLSADYSQIELRVLAHYTEDPELLRAFREDEDIHRITASRIFGVPEDAVTPDQRRDAKTVNFAVLYGQSDFGLSAQLKIPRAEAKRYIEQYFERFPSVKDYIARTVVEARETGFVRTLSGRRRPVPEVNDRNFNIRNFGERAAVNSPIQGTAADIIKVAMIRLREELRKLGDPAVMLLQVHDELVLEVPPDKLEATSHLLREVMENAWPLKAPLKVDVKHGGNWDEMTAD